MERQQHGQQHEGMERESNFYFRKLRDIEVLLQSVKHKKYFKGKVKTLLEEIFHILYDKDDDVDASQCADCQHDQLGQDIHEARANAEEETDFVEIIPSKSTFLDVKTDSAEATYLEISETSSNVNGIYKVFDESVETNEVSTTKIARNPDEKQTDHRPFCASKDDKNTNQSECLGSNHIIQKLEKARKLAETKIREGMAVAADELVRLGDAYADTKRQLDTQRIICKMLAETEEQKRAELEQEIKRVKDQKLRTEFIANEANRQCALLGRENMHLQAHLKEARLKLAYVDAERNEFRLQLTTLRGTLGLLAREPVPAITPCAHLQTPAPASSHSRPGNQQLQQPQIEYLPQKAFANSRSTNGPLVSHALPAWVSVTRKQACIDEPSPAATTSDSILGDGHGEAISGHDAVAMLGNNAGKSSNDCGAQSTSDHSPDGLQDDDCVLEVASVDLHLRTEGKASGGSDTEEAYWTDFSDSESCATCSVTDDADEGEDDYSLVFDDMSTTPVPSPHANQENTPKCRMTRQIRVNDVQI